MPKTLKGLRDTIKALDRLGDVGKEIEQITEANAREIALDARQRAPKNLGRLQQSINARKVGDRAYSVEVGADYGAYVEFGTGVRAQVPPELSQMAAQFKNRGGSFQDGLKAIRDWCKAKGIDEKAAYPIFMSILKKGLRPQPYLYPAYVKGRQQYLHDLQDLLKRLTK